MDNSKLIHHPLDRFSFTEGMGNLDATGRDAVEKLMTMIGDMQFLKGTILGTCARYFLLFDAAWFPRLCLSAQINSAMLRDYLSHIESGKACECKHVVNAAQSSFPLLKNEGIQGTIRNPVTETPPELPVVDDQRTLAYPVELDQPIRKPSLMKIQVLAPAVAEARPAQKK